MEELQEPQHVNNANFSFNPATSRENSVQDITFYVDLTGISSCYYSFRKGWSHLKRYLDTSELTPSLLQEIWIGYF